ncbi:MAG: Ig-like domain-containing protein [Lachnospiraceae bacterium]|nr:Ig-like domain-containing protein [Lachnospiraceae bacterium]
MVRVNWKKTLAATVAAAMTLLAVPSMVFADEADVSTEEPEVYEQYAEELSEDAYAEPSAEELSEDIYAETSEEELLSGKDEELSSEEAVTADPADEEADAEDGDEADSVAETELTGDGDSPTDPHAPMPVLLDNKVHTGHLNEEGENHYYRFEVKNPGRVTLKVTSDIGVGVNLLDDVKGGDDWWNYKAEIQWADDDVHDEEYTFDLIPATYYMELYYYKASDYSFSLSFKGLDIPKGGKDITDRIMGGSRLDAGDAEYIETNQKYVSMFPLRKNASHEWLQFEIERDNTPIYLTLNSPQIGRFDFALYYDGADSVVYLDHPYYIVYKGNGYLGEKLIANTIPGYGHFEDGTDKFPHGTYYLRISQNGGIFDTGYYNLEIGTRQKANVTGVSFNKNQQKIALGIGGTEKLIPVVKPANADEKTVVWSVSNPLVASVDDEGNVTGVSKGTTKVTATSTVSEDLKAVCEVHVVDVVVDNEPKTDCPANAVKQKVNTVTSEYFGRKFDKYEVSNPKLGSVDKDGYFTSKAPGSTNVTGFVKADGNLYVRAKTCVINIAQPTVKYPLNEKGREVKYFTATYEGSEFDPAAAVDNKGIEITGWDLSDKKGDFVLQSNGKILCKKNGTNCKVTPLFGADKKPGNIVFTLKTVTPKLSVVQKLNQKTGQSFTIKLSNCTEKDEIDWKYVEDPDDTRVTVRTEDVVLEQVNAGKPSNLQRKVVINKAVNGKIVATVNGHDYECKVTVVTPQIKASAINTKVGKAVTVGVKDSSIKSISWESSAPDKVAPTDAAKGKFKAVSAGTAVISAEVGGVTVSCNVTVSEK